MAMKPQFRTLKRPEHQLPPVRELSAGERGYGYRWRQVAALARDRDEQMCRDCVDEGGVALAMETLALATEQHPVDHVIPAHVRPDLFYDLANLRTRCPRHHALKTAEDLRLYGAAPR